MRRTLPLMLALALLLGLCGCGEKEPEANVFSLDDAATLLAAPGVFSDELEAMDRDIFVPWMGLSDESLTDGAVYGSTGASAEELAVLIFTDEAAAQAGLEKLRDHLEDQKEANRDYRPTEMPKLEAAWLERRGNTVLLAVCGDGEAARQALGG